MATDVVHNEVTPGADWSKAATWTMRNGTEVKIRPISPADEALMIRFHQTLSERSVYMRYFESLSLAARTAHKRLAQICFADPERETVLVALHRNLENNSEEIIGVARLSKLQDPRLAELALLIADEFQGCGLGTELLRNLLQAALDQHIVRVNAEMLRDNTSMQKLLKRFGFTLRLVDPRSIRAVLNL